MFLFVVLGLAALIIVALVLAPSLVNLDQIKKQVVDRVEQQLNREVELGQVRLQLFSGLGAGLEQLTIANPEGWQSPHFVKVDTLSVKVALLPLLSRKVEISKIILSDGEIVVERNAQGGFNYDDLMTTSAEAPSASDTSGTSGTSGTPATKPTAPEAPEAPSGPSPLASLLVSKMTLQDIEMTFIDQMIVPGKTVTTAARQVHIDIDNIGLNTPVDLNLSSALLTDGDANVRLTGRIGPIPDNLDFQQTPLQLNLKVEGLQVAPIVPYLGEKPALTAGQFGVDIAVQGTLGSVLGIQGQVVLSKAVMPDQSGQGEAATLPDVTVTQDMTVNLADALLKMTKVEIDLAALQIAIEGTVKPFNVTSPQLDLALNTSPFAIADVLSQWPILAAALPEAMQADGNMTLQTTVKGTPERLHSTAQLDAEQLSIRLSDGTQLALAKTQFGYDATLDMAKSLVTLSRAALDLGFLQATVQGSVANFDTAPQLNLQLKTSDFNPAAVLTQLPMLAEALPQPADLQGDLQLQAVIQGTLDNLSTDANVTAKALSLKSGSFHGGAAANGGMRLDLNNLKTAVKARLSAPKPPAVNVNVTAQRLVFDQQAAAAPAAKSSPNPKTPGQSTSGPAASDVPMAPPINVRGKVALAGGTITDIDFKQLNATFSLINGLFKSQQTVQLFSGAYQGDLTANLAQAKPDYQFQIKLADIQAGDVANTFTSTPNILFGLLNTNVKFKGKGLDWEGISTTLTGSGNISLNRFKLTTMDIMPKLAKGLSAASSIGGFTVPDDLATRSFDKLKATLRIKEGKLHSDDLKLWGPDVQLLGKGVIGLDSSLAFDGTAVLLGNLAKSLGKKARFLLDKEGRVNIPLAIQGTVGQPRIALNENHFADLAQRALTQKVKDKAGKNVQNLLNKVLPGANEAGDKPAQADSPTESPLPGLDKAIDKTLKGLFKRQ